MTFEEWYAKNYVIVGIQARENAFQFKEKLKEAWEAGYNQGYEIGGEEILSK